MNIYGSVKRDRCPACLSTDTESGYWRLPLTQLPEYVTLSGASLDWLPLLNAVQRFDFDRCRHCEAVYLNPVSDCQEHSDESARRHIARPGRLEEYRSRYAAVKSWIPVNARLIVDVACGAGELLDLHRADGGTARTVGIEACAAYVEHVRGRGHEAHQVDLRTQHPDSIVVDADLVVFSEAFEHMLCVAPVMAGLAAMLRPCGRLFFSAQALGSELPIRPAESIYVGDRALDLLCGRLGMYELSRRQEAGRYLVVWEKR